MNWFDENRFLFFQYLTIVAVVTLYWVTSISTVFVNKTLLNSDTVNLNAPFFVTWSQCIIAVLICLLLKAVTRFSPKTFTFPKSKPFNVETHKKLFSLSLLFVATIGFNNLCLSLVGVTFYFISRSLTTIFNVIFTFWLLKERVSIKCILACITIVFGFMLGIFEENALGTLSVKGVIFGILSSLSLSLYTIKTKYLLPIVDNHILLMSYYNNLYSSLLFLPLIYINQEFRALKDFNFSDISFWCLIILGGLFGFLIGFASTLQIQVTSPLTHNISGTAKSCVQTILATYWYNDPKSVLWWISNSISLGGSAAYARIKQLEMARKNVLPM